MHRADFSTLLSVVCLAAGLAGLTHPLPSHAQGSDIPASQIRVLKDFKAELLYTVPKSEQGSWVALCTDPKGRLIVSDQYGKLYRVTLPALDTTAGLKIETLDIPVGQAQGLLYAFDSLYVMVANEAYQGRGLYRVRDTNGDDQFDDVKLLRKLSGGGEHGPHAILITPDGKGLTIISGNQTRITELDGSRVPRHWSEDHLLPRLWDGNGFMKGVLGPGGWIAHTDPEGKSWELHAVGFRNEYDAGYNRHGELFTYDADMEWDMNTPWYRATRINFTPSGAEFGWRSGAGKWPAYYPDSLPGILDIGPGSPTGVTFGYGAKFPAKYQEAFFICDWSYGKLYAVHLTPAGAGYSAVSEEFVTGAPLALTDIVINPTDGAMYFAVGGRRTQSGLYRVTYTGRSSTAPSRGMRGGERERALRRQIETYHGRPSGGEAALRQIWPALSHTDRWIRHSARVALEFQDVQGWHERALSEKDPHALIQSMIALSRVTAQDVFHRKPGSPAPDTALRTRILAALDRLAWNRLDEPLQLDLLRAYSLAFTRLGNPSEAEQRRLIAKFQPLFPAKSRDLNAELAALLVYLEAPEAATKITAQMKKAPSQEEQMEYARSLRALKTGWTPSTRRDYFQWYVNAGNFRGGASLAGFLRDMKKDAVSNLSEAEQADLKPILEAKVERKSLLEILSARTFVKEWKLDELAPLVGRGLKGRNFDRGRELFGAAACYNCHRFATEGGAVGPDLTGVSGRFSPRDLLESILDPNKEVSDQYAPIEITKTDGSRVTGRIVNLNDENLNINPNMFDPNEQVGVRRRDIASIEPSKVSMMPEGILNSLNEADVLDLMAFLLSAGDRNHRMFR